MLLNYKGCCLDDGTGRNVYYVDENGEKSRKEPEGYVYPTLDNGDRRYYSRGLCIRCKSKSPLSLITKNVGEIGFSYNICEACIIMTTTGIKRIKDNGEAIWVNNLDTPKSYYGDLKALALNPNKETDLIKRGREANFHIKTLSKQRRNIDRADELKFKAAEYGVYQGKMISWGFGMVFDEYFGFLDPVTKLPHGMGVRFYSDGSVYHGEWLEGNKHTLGRGLWIRPDGSQYEGQWLNGLKHGHGTQTYPDESKYVGEFAKGYEHGHGKRTYQDKSTFEGRHRFGKRDGPGVFTTPDGHETKKVFKDSEVFHEKAVPDVTEEVPEDVDGSKNYFEPKSLMFLAIKAVAKTMHKHRKFVPTALLKARLADYLKPMVAKEFLETANPPGSKKLLDYIPEFAFRDPTSLSLNEIKFIQKDFESLIYLTSCNTALTSLSLTFNKLDPVSMDSLSRKLQERTWLNLVNLDLSFNKIDFTGLQNLVTALDFNPNVKSLKLKGCKINANGAAVLASFLIDNAVIEELDLSFNAILVAGAEAMAEAIIQSKSLTSLDLRSNNIGAVGGQAVVNAVRHSSTLKKLCIIDNKIGAEILTQLSGLLKGNIMDLAHSVKYRELTLPPAHREIDRDRHLNRAKKLALERSNSSLSLISNSTH